MPSKVFRILLSNKKAKYSQIILINFRKSQGSKYYSKSKPKALILHLENNKLQIQIEFETE